MIAGRMRREGTFRLRADFVPEGDQPQAIAALTEGVREGAPHQVLLGVTGSGKTFTASHVIANLNKPTLVIAPNKTLAAQLYHEFRTLFPDNAVRYFVSYYDYYQPEAYVPSTDTYIEKDASINDEIDKMRHAATKALLERNDVVVVASVSCIYGLGSPTSYFDMLVFLDRETQVERDVMLRKLVDMQYQRSDYDFHRGTSRRTRRRGRSASSSSATGWRPSPRSIPSAAPCCDGSSAWRSTPRAITWRARRS